MWCALKLRCEWQSMASQGLVISLLSLYFFNVNTLASARSCAVEWSWVRAAQRSLKYYPSDVVWDLMHLPNHIMFPQCSYMYSSEWAFLIEIDRMHLTCESTGQDWNDLILRITNSDVSQLPLNTVEGHIYRAVVWPPFDTPSFLSIATCFNFIYLCGTR